MNRHDAAMAAFGDRVPRTRGDEPDGIDDRLAHIDEFPAHAGMNLALALASSRAAQEFPAHAGMNR